MAKEQPAALHDHDHDHAEAPPAPPSRPRPELKWDLPAGWKEAKASQMSLATFDIESNDGRRAQVAVTPLPNMAGREALVVNMWRKQVGESELSPDEVNSQFQPVEINGAEGKLFEVSGKTEEGTRPMRIVTAMVHKPDASWFFKLAGDQELVAEQKTAFITFLKTFRIGEAPASAEPQAPVAAATAKDGWKTPADWKTVAPGPMQIAKFSVPEKNSAKADVTISVFPDSTGGTLANANRWRNQIGLPPIGEGELKQIATPLDEKTPNAAVIDVVNGSRRLVGAIVPRDGQWFFFKLLGDTDAVAAQKEAFVAFAKSPR